MTPHGLRIGRIITLESINIELCIESRVVLLKVFDFRPHEDRQIEAHTAYTPRWAQCKLCESGARRQHLGHPYLIVWQWFVLDEGGTRQHAGLDLLFLTRRALQMMKRPLTVLVVLQHAVTVHEEEKTAVLRRRGRGSGVQGRYGLWGGGKG